MISMSTPSAPNTDAATTFFGRCVQDLQGWEAVVLQFKHTGGCAAERESGVYDKELNREADRRTVPGSILQEADEDAEHGRKVANR